MNYTARQAFHTSSEIVTNFEAVRVHIIYLCMETIKRYSEFHFHECTFQIPQYLIGYALFDPRAIRRSLKSHLKGLEYKVKKSYKDEYNILISWGHIGKTIGTTGFLRT